MESNNNPKNIEIVIGEDYPIYIEGNSDTIFNFIVNYPANNRCAYLNFYPENAYRTQCNFHVNPSYWEGTADFICQYTCQCQYLPGNYIMNMRANTILHPGSSQVMTYNCRIEIQVNENSD